MSVTKDPHGIWACPRCTNENSTETCQACGFAPEWSEVGPRWGDRIPTVGAYILEFTIQDLHRLLEMAGNRNGRVQVAYNPAIKKWATSHGPIEPPHVGDHDFWVPPSPPPKIKTPPMEGKAD